MLGRPGRNHGFKRPKHLRHGQQSHKGNTHSLFENEWSLKDNPSPRVGISPFHCSFFSLSFSQLSRLQHLHGCPVSAERAEGDAVILNGVAVTVKLQQSVVTFIGPLPSFHASKALPTAVAGHESILFRSINPASVDTAVADEASLLIVLAAIGAVRPMRTARRVSAAASTPSGGM